MTICGQGTPGKTKGAGKGLDGSIFSMRQVSTFYGMWTLGVSSFMKSQDILLLFKMASLHAQEENLFGQMESESNSNMVEELLKPRKINRMTAGGASCLYM